MAEEKTMDEEQTRSLLSPTPEMLASVKVFPLIPAIKRDVEVSLQGSVSDSLSSDRFCRKT